MVEYDRSTVDRREQEVRRQRKEQNERDLKEVVDQVQQERDQIDAEEATTKHIRELEKLRDWEAGTDPVRSAVTQSKIDNVRAQWLTNQHRRSNMTTETRGLFIDESEWEKSTSGGWSLPPIMPDTPTLGWLAEVQPNNSRGGYASKNIILVFKTDEDNGSYYAPLYIGLEKALWVLRRIADRIGLELSDLNVGIADGGTWECNYPCLIDWREYEGKAQVADAYSVDTEGL